MSTPLTIRKYKPEDAGGICALYNYYVGHTTATFDTEPLSDGTMRRRLDSIAADYPCLVAVAPDGGIAGYAYAHRWKERDAYVTTAETTIYLHPHYHRNGIGRRPMTELAGRCRAAGIHTLIACLTAENESSCRFHENIGFVRVSYFREVGRKFNRWLDIADYQLVL